MRDVHVNIFHYKYSLIKHFFVKKSLSEKGKCVNEDIFDIFPFINVNCTFFTCIFINNCPNEIETMTITWDRRLNIYTYVVWDVVFYVLLFCVYIIYNVVECEV